ncbi:MAG TPA: hypothetical protein VF837_01555, partial [Patescibacteria group bacterium]
ISKIYDPNFVHVIPVYGNYMADFRVDSDIVSQYADNNDRFDLLNEMVASGNAPDELQNLLLEPAIARWR